MTDNTIPSDLSASDLPRTPALLDAAAAGERVAAGSRLIDVRSTGGRAATGAIPGADIVDREQLEETFADTPRDQPIVVVCGSVNGSAPVADWLVRAGFTDVAHVDGGFAAWRDAGLPAEAPTAEAPTA